jgi:hypothetical protein
MEETASPKSASGYESIVARTPVNNEASSSGMSWTAALGGGFVTAALSLILLGPGTGLGLSSVSPWSNVDVSTSKIGRAAILWLILMQIMSSSLSGYLAGRLRRKWATTHTDEVHFRDTAHGFLALAVALVITAGFMVSASASMVGAATSSDMDGRIMGVQAEQRELAPNEYCIDTLFRSDRAKPDTNAALVRGEAGRIFANALRRGDVSAPGRSYLAQLVAARTGLSQADADKRVFESLRKCSTSRGHRPRKGSEFIVMGVPCSFDWGVLRESRGDRLRQATGSRCNRLMV